VPPRCGIDRLYDLHSVETYVLVGVKALSECRDMMCNRVCFVCVRVCMFVACESVFVKQKIGWSYGVMVSTLDFESSDPGSNPGRTSFLRVCIFSSYSRSTWFMRVVGRHCVHA
jgi:hypothetical protein